MTTSTNPNREANSYRSEEFPVADPQRAADRIAANFANGTIPRETSRRGLGDQLGVEKPRRRRGRSAESKALADQLLAEETHA
ncbi:hypothetical protein [Gordonia polyisoprenivorans]|uniref:hypothetical protein n=1 Tax=Gordonia polyisoprenivorans TaxID=84595 RepID=UPI0002F39DA9|nr:hypothetical protein [Gordonia polyisoprenivorans]